MHFEKLLDKLDPLKEYWSWGTCEHCGSSKFKLLTIIDEKSDIPKTCEFVCAECGDASEGMSYGTDVLLEAEGGEGDSTG